MAKDVLNKSKLAEGYEKVLNNALSGEEINSYSGLSNILCAYVSDSTWKTMKVTTFMWGMAVAIVTVMSFDAGAGFPDGMWLFLWLAFDWVVGYCMIKLAFPDEYINAICLLLSNFLGL